MQTNNVSELNTNAYKNHHLTSAFVSLIVSTCYLFLCFLQQLDDLLCQCYLLITNDLICQSEYLKLRNILVNQLIIAAINKKLNTVLRVIIRIEWFIFLCAWHDLIVAGAACWNSENWWACVWRNLGVSIWQGKNICVFLYALLKGYLTGCSAV